MVQLRQNSVSLGASGKLHPEISQQLDTYLPRLQIMPFFNIVLDKINDFQEKKIYDLLSLSRENDLEVKVGKFASILYILSFSKGPVFDKDIDFVVQNYLSCINRRGMACLTFTEFEKKLAEKELACNSNEMCSGGKQVEIILDSLDFYKYFSGYNKLFGYNNFCNNFAEIDKNMDITSFPYFIPAFSFVIKQLPCEFDISGFLKVQRRSVIQPDTFYSSKFD